MSTKIIVVRETLAKSILRDIGTLGLFVSLIGVGVALDSGAMQWTGAAVGFLVIIGRTAGHRKELTIQQAREYLDKLEAGHDHL